MVDPKSEIKNPKSIIILPAWLVADARERPRPGWGVRITRAQIADVAPNDLLRQRYPDDQVWDAAGQVLAPGFVNTHTHLYGVLAHGIPLECAPSGFWPFLREFWWPQVEDRLDHEMCRGSIAPRWAGNNSPAGSIKAAMFAGW